MSRYLSENIDPLKGVNSSSVFRSCCPLLSIQTDMSITSMSRIKLNCYSHFIMPFYFDVLPEEKGEPQLFYLCLNDEWKAIGDRICCISCLPSSLTSLSFNLILLTLLSENPIRKIKNEVPGFHFYSFLVP